MAIDGVPFDHIQESHLQDLVRNGVPESRTLDYKRDAYGHKDDERREFLADVSALANTMGGHLVIGMDEVAGVASELCGLPEGSDPDREITRLENIARDGLQPRLSGVRMGRVDLSNGRHAIVIRVAPSLNPPHRVVAQKSNRFFARNDAGKYEPDVDQLREMFMTLPDLTERFRRLQAERLDAITIERAGATPDSLVGTLITHIAPFSALALGGHRVTAAERPFEKLVRPGERWGGASLVVRCRRKIPSGRKREGAGHEKSRQLRLSELAETYLPNGRKLGSGLSGRLEGLP